MRGRIIAAVQLMLISPAALFISSLVVRNVGPLQHEPAHSAHLIVMWYAERLWTLWLLLFGLPLAVLVCGCMMLCTNQPLASTGSHWTARSIAITTVSSAGILTIVIFHVLTH